MKYYEILWNTMKYYVILWNTMVYYEISWNAWKYKARRNKMGGSIGDGMGLAMLTPILFQET